LNPLILMVVVGSLSVGIYAFAVFHKVYKGRRAKYAPDTLMSGPHEHSPSEVAKRMVKDVRMGHYLMHTLTNKALPFDDDNVLKKYKSDIRNPVVIDYIKSVKGESQYE